MLTRPLAVACAATTGLSLSIALPALADTDRTATELVVTARQDRPDAGGLVLYEDATKAYVNAGCKQQLIDLGVSPRRVGYREVSQLANVPAADRPTCEQVGADLTGEPDTQQDPPDDPSVDPPVGDPAADEAAPIALHVTKRTSRGSAGGFVVLDERTWVRVDPTCKATLIESGIARVESTWATISAFDRDQTLTCEMIVDGLSDQGPADPDPDPDAHPDPDADSHQHAVSGEWVSVTDETAEYRDAAEPTRYYLFDPELHDDPTWGRTRIGWLVECDSVGFKQVDPIVAPGADPSAHLHEFFGNPAVTELSTTQSLADTPGEQVACTDTNDRSAYWSPAAYQDGRRVTADLFKAYYKSTTPDVIPMPLGLRMVAGNAMATGNQSDLVGWFEQQRTNDLTPRELLTNTIGDDSMITRANSDVNIVLRINFPNCWDGEHLDSPDHQSHVTYADVESQQCPPAHPVKIPQLVTFTQYDTVGGDSFTLASGDWYTFHQDFWNAWSPEQLTALTDRCIVAELNCRIKGSGALERRGQYPAIVPAP